jgi:hypothetical protein
VVRRSAQDISEIREVDRQRWAANVASRSTGCANACPRALELRVDAVGGAPHIDPEYPTSSRPAYALAAGCGRPVDLPMDERLRSSVDLQDLVRVTVAGFPQPVTEAHVASLGMRSAEVRDMLTPVVARAGIAVGTCTGTNLHLLGCDVHCHAARPDRAAGSVGRRRARGGRQRQRPGPLDPLACGGPRQTAGLLVLAGQLDMRTAYRLSENARAVLGGRASGHAGRTRRSGGVAGRSLQEAVATTTEDRIVFRARRVVCRTRVVPERTRYHQTQEVPMPESVDPDRGTGLTMDSQRRKIDEAPWP